MALAMERANCACCENLPGEGKSTGRGLISEAGAGGLNDDGYPRRLHLGQLPEGKVDRRFSRFGLSLDRDRDFERGHGALKRLDQALGTSDYLIGERCTLADISLVAHTRVAHEGGFDLALYPAVRDWIRRVETVLDISD